MNRMSKGCFRTVGFHDAVVADKRHSKSGQTYETYNPRVSPGVNCGFGVMAYHCSESWCELWILSGDVPLQ